MKIVLNNNKYNNILFFDIEYDKLNLVQLALLKLTKTNTNIYEVKKSINLYVNIEDNLSKFFTEYTNIEKSYLESFGIKIEQVRDIINEVLNSIDLENTLIVSHGIKNDLLVLDANNINLKAIPNHYCTYNAAKRLLKRDRNLTLSEVAMEGCYSNIDEHNAYSDVWATLHAFCLLDELEYKERVK